LSRETIRKRAEFPRGWFMVARSDEVGPTTAVPLFFFSRKLVAFRAPDGAPSILDAICPHLGAHLAFGGIVDGGGIRCPFHHWRYGPDGKCNDIPYNDRIPPRARLRAYPTREINGNIFAWYDCDEGEPDYQLPTLQEFGDPAWKRWTLLRQDIATVPNEIIDNIADKAHFPVVHFSRISEFKTEFVGHRAYQHAFNHHETLAAEPGGDLRSTATYHGPGFLLTLLEGHLPSWMLVCNTPIDGTHVAVWCGAMVRTHDPQVAEDYEALSRVAFLQDVQIWENKASAPRPLLVANDGPILQARAWYEQFFRPRETEVVLGNRPKAVVRPKTSVQA
jgi:3-ketosteroid 9alpha-monooxygenase subunit A